MQCFLQKSKAGAILFTTCCLVINALSQELIPVSLAQKVNGSLSVVLGKIIYQETFTGPGNNIYTLHEIEVSAYTKAQVNTEILLITPGGVFGNKATVVNPSVSLQMGKQYVLFLEQPDETYF